MIWFFVVVAGALILLFIHDKSQAKDPFLRRFPVLSWGRKILVELGPFMRQYWFANDARKHPITALPATGFTGHQRVSAIILVLARNRTWMLSAPSSSYQLHSPTDLTNVLRRPVEIAGA